MCPLSNDPSQEPMGDDDSIEVEVVELVDDQGEKEEFVILEEITFEGRPFCIMVPLEELEAQEAQADDSDASMNLEIFEVKGENYVALEDEALAERLMAHLDAQADKLADNED
ncbi:MAG: hypothetical protein SGVNAXEH_001090 [Holophagaceae bacterium]|jgi:hypothetical protein